MPLEPELLALMTSTVVLEPCTGRDQFGRFEYGAPVSVDCYLIRATVKAVNDQGEEVTSDVQAILAQPELAVSTNDRLTLPGGRQLPIVQVLAANDDEGPYYLEVRG